jgi:hypothetical protein
MKLHIFCSAIWLISLALPLYMNVFDYYYDRLMYNKLGGLLIFSVIVKDMFGWIYVWIWECTCSY